MSDGMLILFGVLELAGLLALFAIGRRNVRRRREGHERPSRPVRIATALFGLVVVVGFPTLIIVTIRSQTDRAERLRSELAETGRPATAKIHLLEETGNIINRRPEMRVYLTVRPEGRKPFDAESVWVFSVQDVQNYRVGAEVRVVYDPNDHAKVAVTGLLHPPDSKSLRAR